MFEISHTDLKEMFSLSDAARVGVCVLCCDFHMLAQ